MDKLLIFYSFFFWSDVFCLSLKIISKTTQYIFNEHYPYFSNTILIVHLFCCFSLNKPVFPTIFCSIQLFPIYLKSNKKFTNWQGSEGRRRKPFWAGTFSWIPPPVRAMCVFCELPQYYLSTVIMTLTYCATCFSLVSKILGTYISIDYSLVLMLALTLFEPTVLHISRTW